METSVKIIELRRAISRELYGYAISVTTNGSLATVKVKRPGLCATCTFPVEILDEPIDTLAKSIAASARAKLYPGEL